MIGQDINQVVGSDDGLLVVSSIVVKMSVGRIIDKQTIAKGRNIGFSVSSFRNGKPTSFHNTVTSILQQFERLGFSLLWKQVQNAIFIRYPVIPIVIVQRDTIVHLHLLRLFEGVILTVHGNDFCPRKYHPLALPDNIAVNIFLLTEDGRN